jgi:hypothetical protein
MKQLPMTTEQAAYVIAHDNGIKIHKHLSEDEVAAVRALQSQLRQTAHSPSSASRKSGCQDKGESERME